MEGAVHGTSSSLALQQGEANSSASTSLNLSLVPENSNVGSVLSNYWYVGLVLVVLSVVSIVFLCACIVRKQRRHGRLQTSQLGLQSIDSARQLEIQHRGVGEETTRHINHSVLKLGTGSPGSVSIGQSSIPSPQPSFSSSHKSVRSSGRGSGHKRRRNHSPGHTSSGSEDTIRPSQCYSLSSLGSSVSTLGPHSGRLPRAESISSGHGSEMDPRPQLRSAYSSLAEIRAESRISHLHSAPSTLSVSSTQSRSSQHSMQRAGLIKVDVKVHLKQEDPVPSQIAAALAESARQLAQSAANFEQEDEWLSHPTSNPSPHHWLSSPSRPPSLSSHLHSSLHRKLVSDHSTSTLVPSRSSSTLLSSRQSSLPMVSLDRHANAVSLDRPKNTVSLDKPRNGWRAGPGWQSQRKNSCRSVHSDSVLSSRHQGGQSHHAVSHSKILEPKMMDMPPGYVYDNQNPVIPSYPNQTNIATTSIPTTSIPTASIPTMQRGGTPSHASRPSHTSRGHALKALTLSENLNTTAEAEDQVKQSEEGSHRNEGKTTQLRVVEDMSLASERSCPLASNGRPVSQDEKALSLHSSCSLSHSGSGLSLDRSTASGYAATGSSSSIDTFTAQSGSSPRNGGPDDAGAMAFTPKHGRVQAHDQRVSQHPHSAEHERLGNIHSYHEQRIAPLSQHPKPAHLEHGTGHTHSYEAPPPEVFWTARLPMTRDGSHSFPLHVEQNRRHSLAEYSPENITIDV